MWRNAYISKVKSVDKVGHVLVTPFVELRGDDILVASGSEVLLYNVIPLVQLMVYRILQTLPRN